VNTGAERTGISSVFDQSPFLSFIIFRPFSILGSAIPPPMFPTTFNGASLLICRLAQYSRAKAFSRHVWTAGEVSSGYGEAYSSELGEEVNAFL